MSQKEQNGFNTRAIHSGVVPDKETGSVVEGICQSVAYVFDDADDAADKFTLKKPGYSYSRLTNPTVAALETKLADLDGGAGATCTSSGLAAHQLVLFALMGGGDDFVASSKLYGGTVNQFKNSFSRGFGWNCNFVHPDDPENFKAAITENTKAIFMESISNPEGAVTDIEAIATIADDAGIPLIVDNTIPTPYLCRPMEWGASIVTYSTTKYLNGHANSMGGAVVDSGRFDWVKYGNKFPALGQPEPSYHGLNFHEEFGPMALTFFNHAVGLRDLGSCQQPMNAFLTLTGMETLGLRMDRHSSNALKVAEFLENHEQVEWVSYPGLASSPYKGLVDKYAPNGASSLFCFGVKGGFDHAVETVNNVEIFSHLAHIGDTRSLMIHPASTTHSQLTDEQKKQAGVKPESLRISIGLENVEDIIADLDQAMQR